MHVAQFVQRYPPALGGSEAYTARLCEYLAARGDDVRVWTSTAVELGEMWQANPGRQSGGGASADEHPRTGVRGSPAIRSFPPMHFPARRYALKALSLVPHRLWQCLTAPCNPVMPAMWRAASCYSGPLDAVHATAFPYSFPIACGLRLARRRDVPFLLTPFLHLGDPTNPRDLIRRQYTKPHLRWLLRQADRVFVQTRMEADFAESLGVPAERVVLQGLGVEPSECTGGDRDGFRAACGLARDEVVIGHLANNSFEKGTVDLLRAAERAWVKGPKFRVLLAGPEMPNFRAFWERFGPKDRVTRLGVLTDEQKRDFYAGIEGFALPSRCDSFGLVLLEAWTNAKPNLVYRAGGPAELVRHETDGLQAACGDVIELARQLGRLVSDAGLRRALGASGQARVAREFRWADKLELVREALTSAAAERNPRHRSASERGAVPRSPRSRSSAPARTSAPR